MRFLFPSTAILVSNRKDATLPFGKQQERAPTSGFFCGQCGNAVSDGAPARATSLSFQPLIFHTAQRRKNICFPSPGVSELRPLILFDFQAVMHRGFFAQSAANGRWLRRRAAKILCGAKGSVKRTLAAKAGGNKDPSISQREEVQESQHGFHGLTI
jgi:hypothetical protein